MSEQTTPPKDSTSDELGDQEVQAAKETNMNIEELNMVNREFDHLMDLIADLQTYLLKSKLNHQKKTLLFQRFQKKIQS